jgi:peptidoglycan/LPS O-acetylase OafA/YrhL
MSAVSWLPIVLVAFIALASIHWLDKHWPLPQMTERISTLDGLRGYLALAVFLHHACIWHFFLKTGQWQAPPSRIYTHMGQSAVSLFFMITGYLFFAKILDAKARPLDWVRLYVSRCLRILPLFLATTMLVFVAYFLQKYQLLPSVDAARYASVSLMLQVTAGVRWTLSYEWRFYFLLPVLAWLCLRKPPWIWLAVGAAYISASGWHKVADIHGLTFLGGMAAAWLRRSQRLQSFAITPVASAGAAGCLAATVLGFDTAHALLPSCLLAIAFVLIANGTHLFGLLHLRCSHLLGHITFGVYLLHGMALFCLFRFVLSYEFGGSLNALQHWLVILGLTPVLIAVAFVAFKLIEEPAMAKTMAWTARLRQISWLRTLKI